MPEDKSHAFGSPGIAPRWTSSAKSGIGTAYHTGCRAWFTLSHGIVDEVYYPNIDKPNTRDLELLITDGKTFCHEEKSDLDHRVEMPEKGALLYRLTGTDRKKRYRIVKEVIADPHRSVLLMRVKLNYLKAAWKGRLKIFALLAPHIGGQGADNKGSWCELGTGHLLHAQRAGTHLVFGCDLGFSHRSVGYVGESDGWTDLRNYQMDWEFREAGPGNIAMMGEIDLQGRDEFSIGVGFGETDTSAVTALLQSFASPFSEHRKTFIEQWRRSETNGSKASAPQTDLARVSRMVLLAHEDKVFQGAMVASLSIPWGEIKGDFDRGGYHLVWTRDLVQSASALISSGQTGTALRALIWLAATQKDNGGVPQNSWADGSPFREAIQLDETAALLLLACRLRAAKALAAFDPWNVLDEAAAFLIKSGPVTAQERWEENAGYSPSTLAAVIAGMVGAADFAADRNQPATRDFLLAYADWLNAHVEDWTVTDHGSLHPKIKRHYIRLTPADPRAAELQADPNHAHIQLANGGGRHPARQIVSQDFLQLVRLGLRLANDPLIVNSLKVVDRALKRKLKRGPGWRRYPHDGYGQKKNGDPFDGAGVGRCWPLLTGERGHYAIAAGKDAQPFLSAMEHCANEGLLLPEQVWDEENCPDPSCHLGGPTGSAMPLCWSHAEYLTLVRSQRDGKVFDRIESAYRRYAGAKNPAEFRYEFWSLRYRRATIRAGKILRIIAEAETEVSWTQGPWAQRQRSKMRASGLSDLWYIDLPAEKLLPGHRVEFTFDQLARWKGIRFSITIA